jgi:hypothetical protein
MYDVSRQGSHLLITFGPVIDRATLLAAIATLTARPDYPHSNDVWLLDDAVIFISHEDFEAITGAIEDAYPASATRNRTALVTSTGFNTVIASMWCQEAQRLPFQVRVFDTVAAAEDWVRR